jgi:hypothetical protein
MMTDARTSCAVALAPAFHAALSSLAIPPPDVLPDELAAAQPERAAVWVRRFVTDEMAARLWRSWNPAQADAADDGAFRRALRDFFRNAVALGVSLDRFRAIAASLPSQDSSARSWIKPFEDTISQLGAGRLRIYLSPAEHDEYTRDIRSTAGTSWQQLLETMMDGLFYELGITFPPATVLADETLAGSAYRCEWNDLVLPAYPGLAAGRILVNDTADRLALLDIKGEAAVNPANGSKCAVVDVAHREACERVGLTVWDPRGYAILGISTALRSAAPSFVTRSLIELYLFRLSDFDPELVRTVEERGDLDILVQLLRGLAAEGISIRQLPQILNWYVKQDSTFTLDVSKYIMFSMTEGVYSQQTFDRVSVRQLIEMARAQLRRYISHQYTRGQNTLLVYLLDPEIEGRLAESKVISPVERQVILRAIKDEIESLPNAAQKPVILTNIDVRHRLGVILEPELDIPVLSYHELSPDMNIQPIARISADGLKYCLLLETLERLADSSPVEVPLLASSDANGDFVLGRWLADHITRIVKDAKTSIVRRRRGLMHTATSEIGLEHVLREAVAGIVEHNTKAPGRVERLGARLGEAARRTELKPSEFVDLLFTLSASVRRGLAHDLDASGRADAFNQFDQLLESLESAVRGMVSRLAEIAVLQ